MMQRMRALGVSIIVVGGLLLAGIASPIAAPPSPAAAFFAHRLPRWLPVPAVPADNPLTDDKVELGRFLFYDPQLSGNGTFSCASCHQQSLAFTDGLARAIGATGAEHSRSSMSLANVAYNASFGWDDRRSSLESQMEVPMYNEHPIELGLKGNEQEVLTRFTIDNAYVERFRAAFPGERQPITLSNIVKAIASFERVLISADSAFDRYRYNNGESGLSPAAKRGAVLFFSSRLRCSECHADVNMSGPMIFEGSKAPNLESFFHDTGVAPEPAKFRAPTLRNIAVTAPYMHDGSIPTLEAVIAHYAAGGRTPRQISSRIRGFAITASDTADLVAFLHTLTDKNFLTDPAFSNPLSNPLVSRNAPRGEPSPEPLRH